MLKLFTGFGLMAGQKWACYVAIPIVMLNMIEQFALLGASPFWSLTVIIINSFILYALIVPVDEWM